MKMPSKVLQAVFLCVLNVAIANHIRIGDVTEYGEFDWDEGRRQFYATAHIMRPVLCWEDLKADDVSVELCTADRIKFSGKIDETDFAEGTVITFPKGDYLALGCPTPPQKDALSKVDQVVFREIKYSKVKGDDVVVKTKYISGAKVVPEVDVHVTELANTARQISDLPNISLNPMYRSNNIDVTLLERKGSRTIFPGGTIDWSFAVSAGVCDFKFDRLKLEVTWEQSLNADASATVELSRKVKRSKSGPLFERPIPRAGFSISIFLVGRIAFGVFAGIDYEASIEAGASATATCKASLRLGQKVTLGVGKFDIDSSSSKGRRGIASFKFERPVVRANAFAEGFLGVRPFVKAKLELPLVGESNVKTGGTVGVNVDIQFKSVPFRPVRRGRRIGVCRRCHSVQGTIDLEGRRLSVSGKVPSLKEQEVVIREKFLDYRVGTLCLFRRRC